MNENARWGESQVDCSKLSKTIQCAQDDQLLEGMLGESTRNQKDALAAKRLDSTPDEEQHLLETKAESDESFYPDSAGAERQPQSSFDIKLEVHALTEGILRDVGLRNLQYVFSENR